MGFSKREKLSDFCAVVMTLLVLIISAIFFLGFITPIPITITLKDKVPGTLLDGSCTINSVSEAELFRVGNTTVSVAFRYSVSVQTKVLINQTDVVGVPQAVLPCTTFTVKRVNIPQGKSQGSFEVIRGPGAHFGGECGGYNVTKGGKYYFGYYRGFGSHADNYIVESDVPIDPDNPVGTSVIGYSMASVFGPPVDLFSSISLNLDFDDILAKTKDVQFDCMYRPNIQGQGVSFVLNVITVIVAVVCLGSQLVFYQHKYSSSYNPWGIDMDRKALIHSA